jgi:hypothetical protein
MHEESDPGGRVVESQAHRFAAEFLVPADAVRDSLPTSMSSNAWLRLKDLKEEWRVSVQALLMRARNLNCLTDASYRRAMVVCSQRGWRRSEPGAVKVLEQPSILPKAVELLTASGMEERLIAGQGDVPVELFRAITSRTPSTPAKDGPDPRSNERRVVPLFAVQGGGERIGC